MEKKNIDWSELGFSYLKTDYRYVSNYKDGAWDEGAMITDDTVTINCLLYTSGSLSIDLLRLLFPLLFGSPVLLSSAVFPPVSLSPDIVCKIHHW